MDRRQQKTRAAIFQGFTSLLEKKPYHKITIQEIIDAANIGRSTFYAHFETKDELIRALCRMLFDHVLKSAFDAGHTHGLVLKEGQANSIFCHILQHLQEDRSHLLRLLSCESNAIFLGYFKASLIELLRSYSQLGKEMKCQGVPEDFLLNHISGSFVEMLQWWIGRGMKPGPQDMDAYFRRVMAAVL